MVKLRNCEAIIYIFVHFKKQGTKQNINKYFLNNGTED